MSRPRLLTKGKVLDAINRWFVEHGMPPTVEELRKALRVGSTRTVLRYLRWLEEEGEIKRWSGARGLRPLKTPRKGLETISVPIVGEAPAGPLMVADENIEGWVRMPRDFARPQTAKYFLLRVRGNSMNKASVAGSRIEDGDLVLVRQQSTAQSGDIVIALIDGEATVKRLSEGAGYFVLRPQSSDAKHKPIIVGESFRIQGVVCRLLKKGSDLLHLLE